jgi:hypothetical protein
VIRPNPILALSLNGGDSMNARAVFGLILRTLGVLAFLHGLLGFPWTLHPQEGFTATNYLLGYGAEAIVGLLMLVFAEPLARLAYLGKARRRSMSLPATREIARPSAFWQHP